MRRNLSHVTSYSKSRRKAPICWLLQSSKRSYSLWIYYHRHDRDSVFKVLRGYVKPKLRGEETRPKIEKETDRQEEILTEIGGFQAALELDFNLDDGVLLNIAPFREAIRWKEAKAAPDGLLAGKYEWSSMAKALEACGVIPT